MRISRRAFLISTAAAIRCSRLNATPLERAVRYLWSQQADDGGFHSSTYGLLRSGQSLTPFVLDTLLDVPPSLSQTPPGAVERAIAFIKNNTNEDGALGLMDPAAADYPNYSTALAVSAILKARRSGWERQIAPMLDQLRLQQFSETHGWTRDDAPYGAWGMGGPVHRPPHAGHVDLSMTRCVIEALHRAGIAVTDPAIVRALVYIERSQNADGGFYFSTVNLEKNKAGDEGGLVASYGTATADGVLALRAAGVPEGDPRMIRALEWLKKNHQPDRAPGLDHPSYKAWGAGLRFYYAGVISQAAPELPISLPAQEQDGSFRNSNHVVKEDDPLIATTFAVKALLRAVQF